MHAISSYRGNRPLPHTQTHTNLQTGPIRIHCAAKLSTQCNYLLLHIWKMPNVSARPPKSASKTPARPQTAVTVTVTYTVVGGDVFVAPFSRPPGTAVFEMFRNVPVSFNWKQTIIYRFT